jgi:hypothetical protein
MDALNGYGHNNQRRTGQSAHLVLFFPRPHSYLQHEAPRRHSIETQETDLYYKWLKARGGMDFIADFVQPGLEEGIRIDTELNFDPSIVVDRIVPENTHLLYNRIQFATTL